MATNLPIGGTQIDSLPSKTAVQNSDKLPISRDGSAASVTVADFNDKTNGIVGDAFDTAKSYSAGDYCIYNDTLYKFTADKDIGAWDDEIVEATDVTSEIQANTDLIDSLARQTTTYDYSISGNETFDINVGKDGYTALALCGINGLTTSCTIRGWYWVATTTLRIYVNCSSSASGTVTVQVLYKKAT